MFGKWLFVQKIAVTAKGINVGLAELLIIGAYLVWFFQIFIVRTKALPKLQKIDFFVLLLFLSQCLSLLVAPNKMLSMFDIIYNIKYVLIYFFIANNVKKQHLKPILFLFFFAILLESAFAFYEYTTGNVGIGLAKGNTQSEDYGRQYKVPGHDEFRAAGTTNDSHTLGLYFIMLLPLPFAFGVVPFLRPKIRAMIMAVFVIGLLGLIITFSRSALLAFAIAISFMIVWLVFVWKQKSVLGLVVIILIASAIIYPKAYTSIYDRFFNAPEGIMSARFDTYYTALDIWKKNILLGYGPGNYIEALNDPSIRGQTAMGDWDVQLPVHNAFLWIAADQGLLGVISFFGIILITFFSCFELLKINEKMIQCLALAFATAIIGYSLDGLTDPMFRESVPYSQLWICIGIIMSIKTNLKKQWLEKG
jgi:O-antigen ligase